MNFPYSLISTLSMMDWRNKFPFWPIQVHLIQSRRWWAYLDASLDIHDCDDRFTSSFCGKMRKRDGWIRDDIKMSVVILSRCSSERVWIRKSSQCFWKPHIRMHMVFYYATSYSGSFKKKFDMFGKCAYLLFWWVTWINQYWSFSWLFSEALSLA